MWNVNPFAKRETHHPKAILAYRVLAPITWALVVIVGFYYSAHPPADIKHGHRIFEQAGRHDTPFTQNIIITEIYWILLLLSQAGYNIQLFSKDPATVTAASHVASPFILNNLFVFAWILLWTRNHFWGSEIILAAHFLLQHTTHWRHHGLPAFVHLPIVAGPTAWTLTALFWNGAVAVHSHSLAARLVANVFIWVMGAIGCIHVFVLQDFLLGWCLSLLALSLALKQFTLKIIALQWIFAWVIFAVFAVGSFYTSSTRASGRDGLFRRVERQVEDAAGVTDREREPLLNNEQV